MINNPFQEDIVTSYISERRKRAKSIAQMMATMHFGPDPLDNQGTKQSGFQGGAGMGSNGPGMGLAQGLTAQGGQMPQDYLFGSNRNSGDISGSIY